VPSTRHPSKQTHPPQIRNNPMPKLRVRRLPRRYGSVVMSVTLSMSMSAVVSFIVTMKNVGPSLDMPGIWFAAWQVSCAVAVPARFVVAPLVNRFVGALMEPDPVRE
jgi:hypothetical protein